MLSFQSLFKLRKSTALIKKRDEISQAQQLVDKFVSYGCSEGWFRTWLTFEVGMPVNTAKNVHACIDNYYKRSQDLCA